MAHPWPIGPGNPESESDPASLSPRTVLLSPPFGDDTDADADGLHDLPRRSSRGPSLKFRHARERAHSSASARDLLHLLVSEEYESKQTRKMLYTAFERLEHETRRAEAAEARIEETIQRARAINEARVTAQELAVKAQEELKLYKLQLDNAQKEILRAQDVLKAIEAQRDEAEAAAVSARSKARRLNEERLIELAREEGRRLGFEEGVRRGRRIAYREAYPSGGDERRNEMQEVATDVVNRLLEERDEPERIEVLEGPRPVPPPSRTSPAMHRIDTSINPTLENQRPSSRGGRDSSDSTSRSTSTLRQATEIFGTPTMVEPRIIPARSPSTPTAASHRSRPRSGSQPWAGPADPSSSRPISIQHSLPNMRPADFHIPPDNYIPTIDANHNITLPPPHEMQRIPSPTPSQQTLGQSSERGRVRDYVYDNYVPPRRASPDESLASTKQSATSSISQLDIVGLPSSSRHRDRPQNLSVIHEDASMRSESRTDSQTIASEAGRKSFREMGSSDTLRREREAKQQLADELRYSDPSAARQWRRDNRPQQAPDGGPPRHRPPHITVPTPLSPLHRRTPSERQGRSEKRGDHRDHRRLSSESTVPEISVVPPSRSPSDAPSRGRGNTYGFLSPEHAHQPLPIPAPSAPMSNGRSSPAPGTPGGRRADMGNEIYTVLADGELPPGFLPSPTTNAPQIPVIPQTTGGGSQRYTVPPGAVPRAPSSTDRETTRSRSPISFYAPAPVPNNVTYPAPPISRSATFTAGSNPSDGGRRRHDSLSATAGMTPAARSKPIPTTGSDEGTREAGARRQSSSSLGSQSRRQSYGRYNPEVYNDPAYLASSDSLVDSVTDANTAANGRVRAHSPAYSFATLRTNE